LPTVADMMLRCNPNETAPRGFERAAAGERKSALAKEFGISRETVYAYLRPVGATSPYGR
jgi:hypothetical protein